LVEIMGIEYPVAGTWLDIGRPRGINELSLKKAVRERTGAELSAVLQPAGLLEFLTDPAVLGMSITSAKSRLAELAIDERIQPQVFQRFWREFSESNPYWHSGVSQSDRQTLETRIFERLKAISKEIKQA